MISFVVIMVSLRPFGLGLAIAVPFAMMGFLVQFIYLPCSRQALRWDSVTRSPLLTNFGETAGSALGSAVIRALGLTAKFTKAADRLIDLNAVHGFLRYATNRWMDFNLSVSYPPPPPHTLAH